MIIQDDCRGKTDQSIHLCKSVSCRLSSNASLGALPLEGQAEVVLFLHQYFEHLQVKNI
ncbi:hypothetical protein NLX67_15745 [Domibacillus sp. A3M-37]|uniref:hypothetical protein n=1 Tax=Domibacillus sp. A3M-37 TaxID=2962037 RepID=UPI0020B80C6E|nr:hypothetical protein [Domibacillus sp. A3M-37]MCP3763826.1 hypothetical protein [Domibacillus sp. A3M-37]